MRTPPSRSAAPRGLSVPALALFALAAAALLATASGCRTAKVQSQPQPTPAREPIHLTLAGLNDFHGWVQPHVAKAKSGEEVPQGGAALLSAYVRVLRAKNPGGVVLLDAGDMFQGTLVSNLGEGAIVVDVYNQLGVAAAAIGNHEFDYGPVGPAAVATRPDEDALGALKALAQRARFPLLSANLQEAATGQLPGWLGNDGTHLVELKGVKIGIVGLSTPTTPRVTNPENVKSLRFEALAPAALRGAEKVRARGAEVVLLVAHAGGSCKRTEQPRDLSSCDRKDDEMVALLEALPPGTFDAAIAGHTHARMGHIVRETPVIETHGLGRALGTIDLFVDPTTRRVLRDRTVIAADVPLCARVAPTGHRCDGEAIAQSTYGELVPARFRGVEVAPDAELERLLEPALAQVAEAQKRPLGLRLPRPITRERSGESGLGSLLTDSLREVTRADVALLNSGGLRADLPAGELTHGALYEVLPFDNTLALLTVSGDELRALLEQAFGKRQATFQQSGLELSLRSCPQGTQLESVRLAGGKPIVASQQYRVATSDFLARGGSGLAPMTQKLPAERVDYGEGRSLNLRESLSELWSRSRKELVAPKPGRTRLLPESPACATGP